MQEGCFYFRMEDDGVESCAGAVIVDSTEADGPSVVHTVVPVLVMVVVVLALLGAIMAAAILRRRKKGTYWKLILIVH